MKIKFVVSALALTALALPACSSSGGTDGTEGADGKDSAEPTATAADEEGLSLATGYRRVCWPALAIRTCASENCSKIGDYYSGATVDICQVVWSEGQYWGHYCIPGVVWGNWVRMAGLCG